MGGVVKDRCVRCGGTKREHTRMIKLGEQPAHAFTIWKKATEKGK